MKQNARFASMGKKDKDRIKQAAVRSEYLKIPEADVVCFMLHVV
jgi:hypothetical protein